MSDEQETGTAATSSRRAWLAGVGAIGASTVLAACGADESGGPGTGAPPPAGNGNAPDTGGGNNPPEPSGATVVANADEIEVGGGVIDGANRVVVTQPAAGEFRGFSAVCTHQGCIVAVVTNGEIVCACHNSRFSAADGSVIAAGDGGDPSSQAPLPEVPIEVEGSEIRLA